MTQPFIEVPKVLIIDDEESVREAITDILDLAGITAVSAQNGGEGLQILEQGKDQLRLIMLDLSMPGLSGEETFASIRLLNPQLPIIITSGKSASELPQQCHDDPHTEFIQKPFSLELLIERVEGHLENST